MKTSPTFRPLLCLMPVLFAAPAFAQQFQDETTTRFPTQPSNNYTNYLAVGDIDADGDLDLLFANGGGFVGQIAPQPLRVYINDGTGVFTDETVARNAGVEGTIRGISLGDADGDGDLDAIAALDYNTQPKLIINDGNGVFADETSTRLPAFTVSATRGQFADIDNDGDLDIYINNGGTTNRFGCGLNRILINDGTGVYTDETTTRHPLNVVCEPMDVIFGDVDGDFDLDIRTGNRGTNNSKLYRNNGSGVFQDASNGLPGDSACYSYDFGDMNGDGRLDLLGANAGPSNRELLLENDGTGAFTDVSSSISPNGGGDDNDSKFFDIDNDGDMDFIVAALFQSREKIYFNDGSANFTQNTGAITPRNDASLDVQIGDFDNDGDFDIITAQGEAGSFTNRIYINETGSTPDTIAPRIIATEEVDGESDAPYVVRAMILDDMSSDRGFYDKGVTLNVAVDGDKPTAIPMTWVGNSMWRGEIPAQAPGASVSYFVTALDWASNEGTGDTMMFTVGGGSPADLNGDGFVDLIDLISLLAQWGPCDGCSGDIDMNGDVGLSDLLAVLAAWT